MRLAYLLPFYINIYFTTYGTCGVKVWVFRGEILAHDPMAQDKRAQEQQQAR